MEFPAALEGPLDAAKFCNAKTMSGLELVELKHQPVAVVRGHITVDGIRKPRGLNCNECNAARLPSSGAEGMTWRCGLRLLTALAQPKQRILIGHQADAAMPLMAYVAR